MEGARGHHGSMMSQAQVDYCLFSTQKLKRKPAHAKAREKLLGTQKQTGKREEKSKRKGRKREGG